MKPTDKFISAIPDNKILVFCTGDLEPRVDISIDPFEAVTSEESKDIFPEIWGVFIVSYLYYSDIISYNNIKCNYILL